VAYDIDASSLAPVGASWATAFTGVAFTLVVHHVVLPSVTAVVGPPMNGQSLASSTSLREAPKLPTLPARFLATSGGLTAFSREIIAGPAWLVYALRAGPSALAAAALLSIWQMGGLLCLYFSQSKESSR